MPTAKPATGVAKSSTGATTVEFPLEAEEFFAWLASARGRAASTLEAYRVAIAAYLAWLDERSKSLLSAGENDVAQYLAYLRTERELAAATIARAAVSIRGLYRFLVIEELAEHDPAGSLDVPKTPIGLPRALTEEQIGALLASPVGDVPLVRRDRAILEVLYGMGLRVSELVGLSLPDVDMTDRLMRVLGKGNKERIVPIGRWAATALGDWLSGAGRPAALAGVKPQTSRDHAQAIFIGAKGGRLTRQGAWLIVRKHGERAGLSAAQLTPHVLRHSCATHMLEHGADIRSVQELLGHASISSTQRYTAVSDRSLAQAYYSAHPRARY